MSLRDEQDGLPSQFDEREKDWPSLARRSMAALNLNRALHPWRFLLHVACSGAAFLRMASCRTDLLQRDTEKLHDRSQIISEPPIAIAMIVVMTYPRPRRFVMTRAWVVFALLLIAVALRPLLGVLRRLWAHGWLGTSVIYHLALISLRRRRYFDVSVRSGFGIATRSLASLTNHVAAASAVHVLSPRK
jgi:hypothetical protein